MPLPVRAKPRLPAAAPTAARSLEGIAAALRARGLRMTGTRTPIIETLLAATTPVSLQDIQVLAARRTRAQGQPAANFSTVFRLLNTLEELGLAHRVALGRAQTHYELTDPARHQDHLVCTGCGLVRVVEEHCPLGPLERTLAKRYGFRDLSHSLQFFGVCPACAPAASR